MVIARCTWGFFTLAGRMEFVMVKDMTAMVRKSQQKNNDTKLRVGNALSVIGFMMRKN